MNLSDFGRKMTNGAGILQLMDDLGKALSGDAPKAMFGGGNPAQIPEVTAAYENSLRAIIDKPEKFSAMIGNYDTPQGNDAFINSFVGFINRTYGWNITADNIAVTAGSQSGFFMLFNLLAGESSGVQRKIMLPLVPEYIGYADQLIEPGCLVSRRPSINKVDEHEFKYGVDFQDLEIASDVAALCVSRPTNPTGNVLSDDEIAHLSRLAKERDIPLIIDNAYGLPFPGVIKASVTQRLDDHMVLSFSMSKVGLPGARVGIFVGPPELMKALSSANAIVSLASPSFGQYAMTSLLDSGEIIELSEKYIQPFYFERAEKARAMMNQQFPPELPWRLHVYEGAYFFWLWCEDAKKTSMQMYEYLKQRGVVVVPGEYFFPGQEIEDWPHARECLRLNFSRSDTELDQGIPVLVDMLNWAYSD